MLQEPEGREGEGVRAKGQKGEGVREGKLQGSGKGVLERERREK